MWLLLLLLLLLPARAEPTFVRADQDTLDTSVTHYIFPDGARVDLVAVVHLGDPEYYSALDERLKSYEAVLFEAILDEGDPGQNRELRSDPSNPLTAVQMKLCRMLGLAYQPASMDYGGRNFVHADMTARQFEKAMKRNNESAMSLFLKLFKRSMAEAGKIDPELAQINPLVFLSRDPTPKEQMALRRVMARSIGEIEGIAVELQGTTLVSGRNQQCLKVLREQLKKGKKRCAILYGAAHMPDFNTRLQKSFKARLVGQEWLTAWKLR